METETRVGFIERRYFLKSKDGKPLNPSDPKEVWEPIIAQWDSDRRRIWNAICDDNPVEWPDDLLDKELRAAGWGFDVVVTKG